MYRKKREIKRYEIKVRRYFPLTWTNCCKCHNEFKLERGWQASFIDNELSICNEDLYICSKCFSINRNKEELKSELEESNYFKIFKD